jgi:hypothetical protein
MASEPYTDVRRIALSGTTVAFELRKRGLKPWRQAIPSIAVDADAGCHVSEARGVVTLKGGSARVGMPALCPIFVEARDGTRAEGCALLAGISCDATSVLDAIDLAPQPGSSADRALWRSTGISLLAILAYALFVLIVGMKLGVTVPDALIAGAAGGLVFRGRAHMNIFFCLLVFAIVAIGTEATQAIARSVSTSEVSAMFSTFTSVIRPVSFFAIGLVGGFAARALTEKFMPERRW